MVCEGVCVRVCESAEKQRQTLHTRTRTGVMLGLPGCPYHFEFTRKAGHKAGKAPTQDNLIVFYLPSASDYDAAVIRMQKHGFSPVVSFNPWWDKQGKTFEDADGYRVVLQHGSWPG